MKMKVDYTIRQYIVPPGNETRVAITQRHDIDHFYVAIEDYREELWVFREGSAQGGFDAATAERVAETVFVTELIRAGAAATAKEAT